MDRDPSPGKPPAGTPDDAYLAGLVTAVADDWRMPPQRLGQPTWRDQVATGPFSAAPRGRRWWGRLAGAGALAVVATVVLSLTAVYLTGPRTERGAVVATGSPSAGSPSAGASPSAVPSTSALPIAPTPLPALLVNGGMPSVTSVLLQGSGGYRPVDLTTGTLGPELPFAGGESGKVLPRPDGGWVCICVTYDETSGGSPTSLHIMLQAASATGVADGSVDVGTVASETPISSPDFTQVDVHVDASPDGRFAYVSSSHRTASGWRARIDVVDLQALRVAHTIAIPDVDHGSGRDGPLWVGMAPTVAMRLDGNVVLISRAWYSNGPSNATPDSGTDHWSATFDGSAPVAIPALKPATDACGDWVQGLIDDASFFVACIDEAGDVHVGRYGLDGTRMDETDVGRWTGFGVNSARNGSDLFLWDPQARRLVRYDLATGRSDSATAPIIGAMDGPLDPIAAFGRTIGHWLAPTAAAKIFLQPAIAISEDGTTLYALGIDGSAESLGSTGIDAFDIGGDTLTFKSHWQPTADFISIATSADGAFVYATGMGRVDASGVGDDSIKPSVTVFDASDGSVRLLAGQLRGNDLYFLEPVVR